MNFVTLLLIAALLCAESPNGLIRDRYLIAQTIVYRSKTKGLSPFLIVTQKGQYQGLALVDWEGYKVYRQFEMAQNLKLGLEALSRGIEVEVSNFCSVGAYCSWQSSCKLVETTDLHNFYLCPKWVRKEAERED